jgi:hypothetical protein
MSKRPQSHLDIRTTKYIYSITGTKKINLLQLDICNMEDYEDAWPLVPAAGSITKFFVEGIPATTSSSMLHSLEPLAILK